MKQELTRVVILTLGLALLLSACQSVQGVSMPQTTLATDTSQQTQANQEETATGTDLAVVEPEFDPGLRSQLSKQLESLAADLSLFLAENDDRSFIAAQLGASPKTNTVVLREVLAENAAQSLVSADNRHFRLASSVQQAEMIMEQAGMSIPRLDLLLAEGTNSDQLRSSDTIYVAVAPLADESEVETVTAYAKGERLTLSPTVPPDVPTLVIAPAESEFLDPAYPLPTVQEPEDEPNQEPVDDYAGIPYILITDDKTPWYDGEPDIEVRFRTWLKWPGVFRDNTVDLPGVNNEDQWYQLGDPNDTYLYMTEDRHHATYLVAVWERDYWWDDDDLVGRFYIDWTNLPFGGYTGPLSDQDAFIRVDRD